MAWWKKRPITNFTLWVCLAALLTNTPVASLLYFWQNCWSENVCFSQNSGNFWSNSTPVTGCSRSVLTKLHERTGRRCAWVCLKETMFDVFWIHGQRSLFWSVNQIWIIHPSPNIGGPFKQSFTSVNWVGNDGLETTLTYSTHNEVTPGWSFTLNFWLFFIGWLVEACTNWTGNKLTDAMRKLAMTSTESAVWFQSDLPAYVLLNIQWEQLFGDAKGQSALLHLFSHKHPLAVHGLKSVHLAYWVLEHWERETKWEGRKKYWTIWHSRKYTMFSSKIILTF